MHKLIFFAVKYFAFRIFLIKKTELIDPAFKGGGVVRLAFGEERLDLQLHNIRIVSKNND
jgi:hypothetical protein